MIKWKIRAFGQPAWVALEVNPSNYSRAKQVEATYEDLVDGSQCRITSPRGFKPEEYQIVWANVDQGQLEALTGFLGALVEIEDHLHETSKAYVEGLERQYLAAGGDRQRFAVSLKLREG